jgi:hypothetical protein
LSRRAFAARMEMMKKYPGLERSSDQGVGYGTATGAQGSSRRGMHFRKT